MKIFLFTILFGSLVFVTVMSILGYWINLKYFANECVGVLKEWIAHTLVSVSELFKRKVKFDSSEEFYHNDHKKSF